MACTDLDNAYSRAATNRAAQLIAGAVALMTGYGEAMAKMGAYIASTKSKFTVADDGVNSVGDFEDSSTAAEALITEALDDLPDPDSDYPKLLYDDNKQYASDDDCDMTQYMVPAKDFLNLYRQRGESEGSQGDPDEGHTVYENLDECAKLFFRRAGYRDAMRDYNRKFLDKLRKSDYWPLLKLALEAYLALRRNGMGKNRLDNLGTITGSASSNDSDADNQNYDALGDASSAAALNGYVPTGEYAGGNLVLKIQEVDVKMRGLRDAIRRRLPLPDFYRPRSSTELRMLDECQEVLA